MSILSIASSASARRGYEYYESKRVLLWKQISEHEFEAEVAGGGNEPYHVIIDTKHPTKSICNCPHAEGKKIICKHKVALFFTVFPIEAVRYMADIEEYEMEEDEWEQEGYDVIVNYVNSLSNEELRAELISALLES